MLNWDDIHYFVVVGRAGNLARAARILDVNHSTVFRRIAGLESSLGVLLFDRKSDGYELTEAGKIIMEVASQVDADISALDLRLTGQDYQLSDAIRITTTDSLIANFLPPHLLSFRQKYPGIKIELISGNAFLNLSKREADIALRLCRNPPQELVGEKIAVLGWALYASHNYLTEHGAPDSPEDLVNHFIVSGDESMPQITATSWLRSYTPEEAVVLRSNSTMNIFSAIKAGIGMGMLPCHIGESEPTLEAVFPPGAALTSDLWILTHSALRKTAAVSAFMEHMINSVSEESE
jgi:DNA-binding transcriptional LysR family regulator